MIKSLNLEYTRTFSEKKIQFESKNVIFGQNGSGKSTILEAIRIISVGKSFRTSRTEDLVKFEQLYCRFVLSTEKDKIEFFYGNQFVESVDKDRQLSLNGKTVSWIEFIGELPTVLFAPADIDIILGSPDVRRRYLDSILWQVDKKYRQSQLEYSQVLRERSALLYMVKINRADPDELKAWNDMIVRLSTYIRQARQSYVDFLNLWLKENAQPILGVVEVKYQSDQRPLEEVLEQEIRSAQNIYGAHRDELVVEFDDFSARRFASRGQSRLCVVHLKAAEADYLAEKTEHPVSVLLDDVFSELDHKNTKQLLKLFNSKHQLILTTAQELGMDKEWLEIKL